MKNESDVNKKEESPGLNPPETSDVHAAMDLLRTHGPTAGLVLAVAILVAAGWSWTRHRGQRQATEATLQLDLAQTEAEYAAVAESFPSTPAGALALLGLAAERFEDGRYADAVEAYDTFLARFPDHPMSSAARLNRAVCYEAKGLLDQAQSGLEEVLAGDPGLHAEPQAVLALGRVLVARGRAPDARAVYEDYLVRHADSDWTPQVEDALREVNRLLRAASGGEPVSVSAEPATTQPSEGGS